MALHSRLDHVGRMQVKSRPVGNGSRDDGMLSQHRSRVLLSFYHCITLFDGARVGLVPRKKRPFHSKGLHYGLQSNPS